MGTAQEDWKLENAKGALRFAEVGLTSLILVNGAAATVLLNFLAGVKGCQPAQHHLFAALMALAFGVFAAVTAMISAWAYQRCISGYDNDDRAKPYLIIGVGLVFASVAAFAAGIILAGVALQ